MGIDRSIEQDLDHDRSANFRDGDGDRFDLIVGRLVFRLVLGEFLL